jgi:hypothetical protein
MHEIPAVPPPRVLSDLETEMLAGDTWCTTKRAALLIVSIRSSRCLALHPSVSFTLFLSITATTTPTTSPPLTSGRMKKHESRLTSHFLGSSSFKLLMMRKAEELRRAG